MKKLFRTLFWLISLVIILLVIAAVLLFTLVKPNDFKNFISDQVQKTTGYHIVFHGDIHLSFWPNLNLTLGKTDIENPLVKDKSVATIDEIQVGVKVFPLLHKKLETTNIAISGMKINLVQNVFGQTNLAQMPAKKNQTKTMSAEKPLKIKDKTPISSFPVDLYIPTLSIRDSEISYTNLKKQQNTQIKNINFFVKDFQLQHSFPAKLSFYVANNKPELSGTIMIKSQFDLSSSQKIVINDFTINTALNGDALPQKKMYSTSTGSAIITSSSAQVKPLTVIWEESRINGFVDIKDFATLQTVLDLSATPFSYNHLTGDANIQANITAAKPNKKPSVQQLNGNVQFKISNGVYHGINLSYYIKMAHAIRRQESLPELSGPNQTEFGSLSGSAVIDGGVMHNNDFVLSSPHVYAQGAGQVDLNTQKIDYQLKLSEADSNDINTQNIPLIIEGTLKDPRPRLDTTQLARNIIQQQAQKQIHRAIDMLKSHLFS